MAQGKVRYAVVGGGEISQSAFMPGIAASDHSEMTALVTGDPEKGDVLGKRYNLRVYGYIERALDTGQPQSVEPLDYRERIRPDQVRRLTPVTRPEAIIGVDTISGG